MSKQLFLVMLLRRRGLWYSVWYRKRGTHGWYVGPHGTPANRREIWLGQNFFCAVEMIASGWLDKFLVAPDNTPTHISVALTEPDRSAQAESRTGPIGQE